MKGYKKLKKIIQKANPDIMDLKVGCEVKAEIDEYSGHSPGRKIERCVLGFYDCDGGCWDANIDHVFEEDIKEVLGRPITLCDVLIAFESNRELLKDRLWVLSKGYINHTSWDYEEIYGQVDWDLKDNNLDNQSKETKEFLINLLVKK